MKSTVWPALSLAIMCALASAPNAVAQETINYASVVGRVTDPTGAVVVGAQVVARQTETNFIATAETDGEGRFRFPYLRVGPYEISVSKAGFVDNGRQVTLTVGAAFELPVSLTLGTVQATVDVFARATVLEAARSQIAGTVSQAEVIALFLFRLDRPDRSDLDSCLKLRLSLN